MKTYDYKEETITRVTQTLVKTTCDKCGQEIIHENFSIFDSEWFEARFGMCYPEGGAGTSYTMDLCENCSLEMINLLKNHGYKVDKFDYDI